MDRKILVVDDDGFIREILERFLKKKGYTVSAVADGKGALREIRDWKPDIIILDVCMEGIDGFDMLNLAKRINPSVGVIMISGYLDKGISQRAKKEGVIEYVPKPFSLKYIEALIAKVYQRGKFFKNT